ncbi:MAG: hypothetical protein Ct9H300mP1_03630 [Planctomycetaceae bacterium]|nr:MAG: hypothetical protein Ct9H300mP1_03630 [Planctomycetaceae bacterium]
MAWAYRRRSCPVLGQPLLQVVSPLGQVLSLLLQFGQGLRVLLDLTQLRGVTQDEVDLQLGVDVLGAIDAAAVECLGAAEDSGQGVVVGRGDRVKLVVVAPGTGNCQSQDCLANHIQLVVDDVQRDVAAVERFLSDRQQSGRHLQPPGLGPGFSGLQQVTGKLFDQEPVVGDVGVDRVDHVVAVPPRPKHQHVPAAAGRFGKTGHVQPVPGPAFSERGDASSSSTILR